MLSLLCSCYVNAVGETLMLMLMLMSMLMLMLMSTLML